MGNIVPFLRNRAFGPQDIQAMSLALDEVCLALDVPQGDNEVRRVVAERIIALAQGGACNAAVLRERLLNESRATVA